MDKKNGAVVSSPNDSKSRGNTTTVRKTGKLDSMLARFADGDSYNRFEAERLGDHCLHTTVSDLQIKYDLSFDRERERVPNRFGGETIVCRYWLSGDNIAKARMIVGLRMAA